MGAGLVAARRVALLQLSPVSQGQVEARVGQRGVSGVVVLLQVLPQQALVGKPLLGKTFGIL